MVKITVNNNVELVKLENKICQRDLLLNVFYRMCQEDKMEKRLDYVYQKREY